MSLQRSRLHGQKQTFPDAESCSMASKIKQLTLPEQVGNKPFIVFALQKILNLTFIFKILWCAIYEVFSWSFIQTTESLSKYLFSPKATAWTIYNIYTVNVFVCVHISWLLWLHGVYSLNSPCENEVCFIVCAFVA